MVRCEHEICSKSFCQHPATISSRQRCNACHDAALPSLPVPHPLRCFSLIFATASQLKYSLQLHILRLPFSHFSPFRPFALSHPVEAARSLGPDFCHYRSHEGQCTRSLLQFRGSISPKSLPCLSSWPPPSPRSAVVACRPGGVAVASPGAMVCFIIANKAQSLLLHQQNVQLGERVDFLHVAACAMKYCK